MSSTRMHWVVAIALLSSFSAVAGDKRVPNERQPEHRRVADEKHSLPKEQLTACFRRHGHLMDKPAVRNERVCWQAHGYLTADKK